MKNFRGNKYSYIVLGCALAVFGHVAFANDAFENNLIKMDVSENSLGGVKVNLYTSKPYSDSVTVNKKSDSEYVILMPETSNSMISNPVVKSPSGIVKNVDVKTQQYGNKLKGYTKIVISTSKPIEIVPQVQNVGTKISEQDYNELLSQVAKSKKAQTAKTAPVVVKKPIPKAEAKQPIVKKETAKVEQKPAQKPVIIAGKQKIAEQKPLQKVKFKPQVAKTQQPVQKVVQAPVQKQIVAQKPAVQSKPQPVQKVQSQVRPQVQPQQAQPKVQVQPKVAAATPKVSTQTTPVAEQTQSPVENVAQAPVEQKISEPVAVPPVVAPPIAPVSPVQKYIGPVKNIIKHFINNNNIYTVAGVALIPLLFLLLLFRIVRKSVQKSKQQKSEFMKNLQKSPSGVTDYSEKIDDNMTWKEKFQAYTDMNKKSEAPQAEVASALPSSQELDELFGDESFVEGNISEFEEEQNIEEPSIEEPQQVYSEGESQVEMYEEIEEFSVEVQEEPISSVEIESVSSLDEFDINMEGLMEEIGEEEISIDELFGEDEVYPESFEEPVREMLQEPFALYEEEQIFEELEEEDELVKSEFNIDEEKGFYLVDFEDTTALVGHIAEEIFVLKKFDKKINAPLQARVDEKRGDSINYMTRVGSFKALVEVTPKNMNLLIEL